VARVQIFVGDTARSQQRGDGRFEGCGIKWSSWLDSDPGRSVIVVVVVHGLLAFTRTTRMKDRTDQRVTGFVLGKELRW
jgi:hypothetical protein